MKKKYHKAILGLYILIVLAGVVWHAGGVSAEDTIKLTVNSHTTSMAKMANMQPGDVTTSDYTVINEGNEPFNYYVDFKFMSGDRELYDILQMTLQKEGVILYSGVMSEAEARVAVGRLAGGGQEAIQMDVTFPYEAGNEYQATTASVAFVFIASGEAGPSAEPSAAPSASATPDPPMGPTATPTGSSVPGTIVTPSAAPAATASPGPNEATVTDPPVPLGGHNSSGGNTPSASPDTGSTGTGTETAPSPDPEASLPDNELPLGGPDGGDKLPDTAEPWYNLVLLSLAAAVVSVIILRRLNSKK